MANPINQTLTTGHWASSMTPKATETIPEKTAQPQRGNFAVPKPIARNIPPTMKKEARTKVRLSAPVSGYRTSKNPMNPRNRALSRKRKNPLQVPVVNACTRATKPPIRSIQPKISMVAKVAVTSKAMQAKPSTTNRIPRVRNQPQG